jgi:uncharacterized membrane protein
MLIKLYARYKIILPIIICLLFFLGYSTLSIVRHQHYNSFGYDLGINDQVAWRYAHFQLPLTTIDPFPTKTKLVEHVELVYALVAPFYWIWSSRRMLILVRTAWFCFSGIGGYLLAKKKGVNEWISLALTVGYLGFYGVQNDMWADVHSAEFAAGFLMWFIYFAELKKKVTSIIFFLLAITAKENIALLTFLTAFVMFVKQRTKLIIFFMTASVLYLFFIYFIYFPHIVQMKYLYENSGGLFSNLNPVSLVDTSDNRQVFWYSLLSFGFLPLLSPLYLLPALGDLVTYFMFGSSLGGAQGLFGQYRITLAPFLIWATIITIGKYKRLNKWYIGAYLIIFTMLVQYVLHLPLSYLTKQSFWAEPPAVNSINTVIRNYLPANASVVSQDNITPHISQRNEIYTLYPEKKIFTKDSPCGQVQCNWFRWFGTPEFLIVDTSSDWDARHLLIDRPLFLDGLKNLEKAKVITKYKEVGTTILFKVNENPDEYK